METMTCVVRVLSCKLHMDRLFDDIKYQFYTGKAVPDKTLPVVVVALFYGGLLREVFSKCSKFHQFASILSWSVMPVFMLVLVLATILWGR